MKDVFFGFLCVIIFLIIWGGVTYDKNLEQPKYNGGVVLEKTDDFLYGYMFYIKYDNDSIINDRVYQIFYDKYEVGDTIKCLY